MKEIERDIASAVIFSRDGKMLMGRKDPAGGGSFADCWHIPGGGKDAEETLIDTLIREVGEETGLDISEQDFKLLPSIGEGSAKKIDKETGEEVMAHMKYNRFELHLDMDADEIALKSDGEFVEFGWFNREELKEVKQIPGGRKFFEEMGYIDTERERKTEKKFC